MRQCRACGKTIASRDLVCAVCGAVQQTGSPPVVYSHRNEAISAVGVFLAVVLLGVCLSPVLIVTLYLIGLFLPPYVCLVLFCAFAAARRAQRLCRASGGRILQSAYFGYGLLALAMFAVLAVRTQWQQGEALKLQAAQQQFGRLFYPGSQPDPDFPPAIRTSASIGDVSRFYKENVACDNRRSYGGGGDFSISCASPSSQSRVWIKLSSRVDNNEPYVLIRMEP